MPINLDVFTDFSYPDSRKTGLQFSHTLQICGTLMNISRFIYFCLLEARAQNQSCLWDLLHILHCHDLIECISFQKNFYLFLY